ncbi:MAG: DUF1816 domain-containing protein [Phormidesmis sp.]
MKALDHLLSIAPGLSQPWWIKVETQLPDCTYYFGPFASRQEAAVLQAGYVEDLVQEGAQNIRHAIEKVRPEALTIYGVDATD